MIRVFKTGINTQHSTEAIAKQNLKKYAKKTATLRPLSHSQGTNAGREHTREHTHVNFHVKFCVTKANINHCLFWITVSDTHTHTTTTKPTTTTTNKNKKQLDRKLCSTGEQSKLPESLCVGCHTQTGR